AGLLVGCQLLPLAHHRDHEQTRGMRLLDPPLLLGARGRPRADVAALARLLSNLSRFAWEAGERLRSVDLNPVIALPEGQGAWAVDAVLEVEEVADGARS
ncbi:acetate--CoA ligase family protein, partial [Pseudomonas aeruginosa]